jgi:hypothetical protein
LGVLRIKATHTTAQEVEEISTCQPEARNQHSAQQRPGNRPGRTAEAAQRTRGGILRRVHQLLRDCFHGGCVKGRHRLQQGHQNENSEQRGVGQQAVQQQQRNHRGHCRLAGQDEPAAVDAVGIRAAQEPEQQNRD